MSAPTTCSGLGVPGLGDAKGATFDLATGAPKGSFALKGPVSLCNDIVVGADGKVAGILHIHDLLRAGVA